MDGMIIALFLSVFAFTGVLLSVLLKRSSSGNTEKDEDRSAEAKRKRRVREIMEDPALQARRS